MKFEEYLKKKKIDPKKFQMTSPEQFEEWKQLFDQVHPDSFTQQKLFLINNIRRAHLYKAEVAEKNPASSKAVRPKTPTPSGVGKPKMVKPKMKQATDTTQGTGTSEEKAKVVKPKMAKPKTDKTNALKPIIKPKTS